MPFAFDDPFVSRTQRIQHLDMGRTGRRPVSRDERAPALDFFPGDRHFKIQLLDPLTLGTPTQ